LGYFIDVNVVFWCTAHFTFKLLIFINGSYDEMVIMSQLFKFKFGFCLFKFVMLICCLGFLVVCAMLTFLSKFLDFYVAHFFIDANQTQGCACQLAFFFFITILGNRVNGMYALFLYRYPQPPSSCNQTHKMTSLCWRVVKHLSINLFCTIVFAIVNLIILFMLSILHCFAFA